MNRSTNLFLSQQKGLLLLLNAFSKYILWKERNWELETKQNAKEWQNSAASVESCCKDKKLLAITNSFI